MRIVIHQTQVQRVAHRFLFPYELNVTIVKIPVNHKSRMTGREVRMENDLSLINCEKSRAQLFHKRFTNLMKKGQSALLIEREKKSCITSEKRDIIIETIC
jgi:hypothetical protein